MEKYKLQICCLLMLGFIMGIHFSAKRKRSYEHGLFVALLLCGFSNLCIDVVTVFFAYHQENISYWIGRIASLSFNVSILSVFLFAFLYILTLLNLDEKSARREKKLIKLPFLFTTVGMCFLPIRYIQTPKGNYFHGAACNLLYGTIAYYIILLCLYLIRYRDTMNSKKKTIIRTALGIEISVSLCQLLLPYSLISSFGVTILCLALFLTVENPDVRLVECLQEEKKRAERANSAKTVFLASISHEIKTPINGVIGMNEMILRESNDDKIRKYALDVKSAAHVLLGIVNDLLDLTKMESGKMEIRPVEYSLKHLLRDTYHLIADKAEGKGLVLNMYAENKLPSVLIGDDVRIRQILMNLLTNAVKYTESGQIEVVVTGKRYEDELLLHFEVHDSGMGIKEADIQRLFLKFERLDEIKNRRIEGTGLGLTITQQLLEMMGSKLNVHSVYGVGSVFSFDLRQTIVDDRRIGNFDEFMNESMDEYEYEAAFIAPQAHILIVDDNAGNRRVLKSLLQETEIKMVEVESGKKCLECVKEQHFDLIFLDHMMPDMDGIETLQRMMEMNKNQCKRTPVIAFTANTVAEAVERYEKAGFCDLLAKPIVPEKLERMLLRWLPDELIEVQNPEVGKGEKKSGEREQLPYIDGIDWDYARMHIKDSKMLKKLVVNFYGNIADTIKELQTLAEVVEQEEKRRLYQTKVHALKSVTAMIGAMSLSGLAKLLEYAAQEEKYGRIQILNPVLIQELEDYQKRLHILVPEEERKKEGKERKEINRAGILAMAEMLRHALAEIDVDAADDVMKKMNEYAFDEEMQGYVNKLGQFVQTLRLEEAERLLVKMVEACRRNDSEKDIIVW